MFSDAVRSFGSVSSAGLRARVSTGGSPRKSVVWEASCLCRALLWIWGSDAGGGGRLSTCGGCSKTSASSPPSWQQRGGKHSALGNTQVPHEPWREVRRVKEVNGDEECVPSRSQKRRDPHKKAHFQGITERVLLLSEYGYASKAYGLQQCIDRFSILLSSSRVTSGCSHLKVGEKTLDQNASKMPELKPS